MLKEEDVKIISDLVVELERQVEKLFDEEETEVKRFARETKEKLAYLSARISNIRSTKNLFRVTSRVLYEIFWTAGIATLPEEILPNVIRSQEELKSYGFRYCLALSAQKIKRLLNKHGEEVEKRIEAIEKKAEWIGTVSYKLDKITGWH